MTWTWNNTWTWNHRTQTYILTRPRGRAYIWQDRPDPHRETSQRIWWNGKLELADGTKVRLQSQNDHRWVMGQAEELLGERDDVA